MAIIMAFFQGGCRYDLSPEDFLLRSCLSTVLGGVNSVLLATMI